jgi:D-alanyl-D-alanine carboxypeptidase (penicillin-binding protein 5/6)
VTARGRNRAAAVLAAAAMAALALGQAAVARAATVPDCPATVAAPSAIVIEVSTGVAACARAADRRRPVGSTTKLMTALLTLERAKLSDTYTASSYRPAPVESKIGLLPGERMRVSDLLRGLLVESGNDAAAALAQGVAGSQKAFVRLMNQRARELGLKNTHYANAIGLDDAGNYSSARDLVTLATVLRTNAFFKKVVDSPVVTLKTGAHPRTFTNRNLLVRRYGFVNGVKTGHTSQAGYVLVGSASRNGVQLISAVLDTPSEAARDNDTMALFKWAFPRYQKIRAVVEGKTMATVPIRFRAGARLKLTAGQTVRRIVPRGHRDDVKVAVFAPDDVAGPIHAGQRLGRVEVRQGGQLVATVSLLAATAVPAAGTKQRTRSWIGRPLVLVGVFVLLAATVLLARRRRTLASRRPSREASAA